MTTVSDADRAKAAELWRAARYADPADAPEVEDVIADAIAEARAPYDRLTADLRALAEELERESAEAARLAQKWAQSSGAQESLRASSLARRDAAARLRAVVAAAEEAKA